MSNLFNELSQEWWKLEGAFKALHSFNFVRVALVNNIIKENFKKKKGEITILDVGCGGGIFCEPLARIGYNVMGIDTSHSSIKIAKEHCKNSNLEITYHNADVSTLDPKKKFDLITCMEVLEHTSDPKKIIKNIRMRLKPNGYFVGSTINKTILSYLFAIKIAEDFLNLIPKGTHDWKSFIRPNSLKKMLMFNGLLKFKSYGVSYNPIINSWKFQKNCNVNYMFSATLENKQN